MNKLRGLMSKVTGPTRSQRGVKVGDNLYVTPEEFEEYGMTLEEQRTQMNQETMVLFVKAGCHICPKWRRALRNIDHKLKRGFYIQRVDVESKLPQVQWLNPEGAPELYLKGWVVRGATTAKGQEGYLKGFLEDYMEFH